MTSRAARLFQVFCMIECYVKTPKRGKRFHARLRMTDRADRVLIAFGKLLRMAACTGRMARKSRRGQPFGALVAKQARHTPVRGVSVAKLRVRLRWFGGLGLDDRFH